MIDLQFALSAALILIAVGFIAYRSFAHHAVPATVASAPTKFERLLVLLLLGFACVLLLQHYSTDILTAVPGGADVIGTVFRIGVVSVAASLVVYVGLFLSYRSLFSGLSLRDTLAAVLSHVPSQDAPTWPHVLGGVTGCVGACLIGGTLVAHGVTADRVVAHSVALTAAGLIFAILISVVSFWTLCQTKRIEAAQGSELSGFRDLVSHLTDDLRRLNDDFNSHNGFARAHHRVFLVTTNPYFGQLSFPFEDVTANFKAQMERAAANVARSSAANGDHFDLRILCGLAATIRQFHERFFGVQAGDGSSDSRVTEKCDETERFLDGLDAMAHRQVIHRTERIPRAQFVIVGNVVYEFVLESEGFQSEIHKARRITDKLVCDRFRETFDILTAASVGTHATTGKSETPGSDHPPR